MLVPYRSTHRILALLPVLLLAGACAAGPPPMVGPPDDWSAIDSHALATPPEAARTTRTLARHLVEPARNDWERVRALYRWITANVAYDTESFFAGEMRRVESGADVLSSGIAVCDGYSALFQDLATHAGLEVVRIEGFARGVGFVSTIGVDKPNHAWNAVRLDGRWYLLDATWGAGYIDGRDFVRAYDDFWFLAPPEKMVYTHFPENRRWQLLSPPISRATFDARPKVPRAVFRLGFDLGDLERYMEMDDFPGFPDVYTRPGRSIRVLDAPLKGRLSPGSSYRFELSAPGAVSVAVRNGDRWHDLPSDEDGRFTGSIEPSGGALGIYLAYSGEGEGYLPILEYQVD